MDLTGKQDAGRGRYTPMPQIDAKNQDARRVQDKSKHRSVYLLVLVRTASGNASKEIKPSNPNEKHPGHQISCK